jgi:hypothetical protein
VMEIFDMLNSVNFVSKLFVGDNLYVKIAFHGRYIISVMEIFDMLNSMNFI